MSTFEGIRNSYENLIFPACTIGIYRICFSEQLCIWRDYFVTKPTLHNTVQYAQSAFRSTSHVCDQNTGSPVGEKIIFSPLSWRQPSLLRNSPRTMIRILFEFKSIFDKGKKWQSLIVNQNETYIRKNGNVSFMW